MVVKKVKPPAGGVRSARLSGRFGLGGIPEKRHGFRDTAAEENAESQELPEPLFTPTTKADTGHDMR